MPRRLLVIGGIYCLIGGIALVGMIFDMVRNGGIQTNVAAFMLPVGIGLLRAKPSSRRWATFWAGLTCGVAAASALWATFTGIEIGVIVFGAELRGTAAIAYLAAVAFGVIIMCVLAIWMLYTPPVASAFDANRSRKDAQDGPEDSGTDSAVPIG